MGVAAQGQNQSRPSSGRPLPPPPPLPQSRAPPPPPPLSARPRFEPVDREKVPTFTLTLTLYGLDSTLISLLYANLYSLCELQTCPLLLRVFTKVCPQISIFYFYEISTLLLSAQLQKITFLLSLI